MTDSVSVDMAEVDQYVREIVASGPIVAREGRAVVSRGALNIKAQMRAEMSESPHFKGVARAIAYDVHESPLGFEAEIGPSSDTGSPGNLANIAYFGTSKGGGATVPDPQGALDREEPNFLGALAALIDKAL